MLFPSSIVVSRAGFKNAGEVFGRRQWSPLCSPSIPASVFSLSPPSFNLERSS
jgi:hypothetical protein